MGADGFTFHFDGRPIPAQAGQSVAAALTGAGHRTFRQTAGGNPRGLFCGMGVCQDCLVTVDGVPNRRACMTPASPGLSVQTQVALVPLDAAQAGAAPAAARHLAPDVLIVGAGAGGLSAAIAAARAGASVVVLDERHVAGGQYFKQPAGAAPMLDTQQSDGQALLAAAQAENIDIISGAEVWGAFDGLLFLAECDGAAIILRPRIAIIATGAHERPRMVPGWTLPGVMTTGAAQTLWRSYRTLPGRRIAVGGSGPLNVQVALELARGGAEVLQVAETAASPLTRPWAALRLALAGPGLTVQGLQMRRGLRRHGVALRHRTVLLSVERSDGALAATFGDTAGGKHRIIVDAVLMNEGFEPQNEILRLLGATMRMDPAFGHLRCLRSATMETTVPGLYAVGDCAGLGGAPAALIEGRIAGRAAAAACGFGDAHDDFADQRALARTRRFQARLWALHDIAPRALTAAPDEVIVCRCEEITLGDLRAGLADKPGHVGTLKRATRVGMGRCQGRYCGAVAARLVAGQTGTPMQDHSHFAPRVPIKPVSIAAIMAAQEALDGPG